MTLLLIVIIVCLIVWWKDSSNKKAKAEQYKRDTITNVELEREIRVHWVELIDKELKENGKDYAPLEHLLFLYNKYGVPIERWYDKPNKLEQDKEKILREFKRLNEQYEAIEKKASPDNPIYITPSPIYNLCLVKDEKGEESVAKFEADKRLEKSCWGTDLNTWIKIINGKITNYHYIMYSQTASEIYSNLIKLLTRKSLKEKGFNPCPYGVGSGEESAWQEAAKRQERFEEEKKKFPWL